jgi:L-ribulose-5-phosphate 3-epimerase
MKCMDWPIGVCSWSLQTDVNTVVDAMRKLGIEHVHLAVRPALGEQGKNYLAAVQKQDWTISSTMIDFPQEDYSTLESIRATGGIVPDDRWQQNLKLFVDSAKLTADLGVKYISMHAGFIDESDMTYAQKFHERIKTLADAACDNGIMLLLETGQERADELKAFLEKLNNPAVGVNFDPANMILYGKGDPIKAVRILSPYMKHIHIKDALRTKQPGTWGTEVPWGNGEVKPAEFVMALKEVGFNGVMAIEREAGDDRFGDIKLAVERLQSLNV